MSVEKFQKLFSGRNDVYGYNQICIKEPLTKEIYSAHIKGERRIGIYPITESKLTKWLALDLDEENLEKATQLQERFKHYNIPAHIERSKSKGYHIWIFFNEIIEAGKPRLVAEMVMAETQIKCELFPKQDEVKDNAFGNFIFLPLFGADIKATRTVFVHPSGQTKIRNTAELDKLKIAEIDIIEEIIKLNNLKREEFKEKEEITTGPRFTEAPPCIEKIKAGQLKEGDGRNEVAFRLTIFFKDKKQLGQEEIQILINDWNLKNIEPLEKQELSNIIDSVFKGQYKSYGCDSAIIQKFCNKAKCPIISGQDKKLKIQQGVITLTHRDAYSMVFKKLNYEYRLNSIEGSQYDAISASVTLSENASLIYKDIINLSKGTQRKRFSQAAKNKDVDLDLIKIEELVRQQLAKEFEEEAKPKQLYLMTENEKDEATKYLQEHPRLLFDIISATKRMGVIGEEAMRLMVYLCFTSRITKSPLSITVKGEASSGKSFICETVRKLIPEEGTYFITKATQQAFFHLPEDGLQHRIVFIAELLGSEAADYSIRTAQTEGDLILMMPMKNPHTGDIETKSKRVKGPVGFMMTTTKASLFDENETRNFSLFTDDSPALTKRTTEITIQKALGNGFELPGMEINLFKNIQRLLSADFKIIIPFAKEIFSAFPDKPVRIRRDRERFRVLIEVVTLLHQYHRKQYQKSGKNILEASVVDYYLAKKIGEKILLYTIFELGPASNQVWEAVKELSLDMATPLMEVIFAYKDIQKILDWKYEKTKKWVLTLLKAGAIEYAEEYLKGGKGKVAKFRISEHYQKRAAEDTALEIVFLPRIQDLLHAYPCQEKLFYDPFSGKQTDPFTIDSPFQ